MRTMILAAVFLFLGVSCSEGPKIDQTPFWYQQDLKKSIDLVASLSPVASERETTLLKRPPFYEGPMPLRFISSCVDMPAMTSGGNIVLIQDFGEWRNMFIYPDKLAAIFSLPAGAMSVDNRSKKLVAECKVLRQLKDGDRLTGFEIEEIHYSEKGKAIFRGHFQVDFPMGFKTKDISGVGQKVKEYYFIWPAGPSGL